MAYTPIPTEQLATTSMPPATKWYNDWNNWLGLSEFDKTIPLIISSVTIGVCTVNRTFIKCSGHLIGAIIVSLVFVIWMNRATTAFLWYSIGYVFMCFKNGIPDALIIISMSIGFSVLVLINLLVSGGGIFYFITALLSLACGIGGVFVAQSLGGKAVLYDFKGCSCDDCASANTCPSGSKPTFLMKKISNTQS
jgi:hypothetical protein